MKYFQKFILLFLLLLQLSEGIAQFSRQDSLRGTLGKERTWWNVEYYDLTVEPNYSLRNIRGVNRIGFEATANGNVFQVDLQQPMNIDSVIAFTCGKGSMQMRLSNTKYTREGNAYFLKTGNIKKGTEGWLEVYFSGEPRVAVNPPWDGGWIWSKDALERPWMSVACQGLGASVWYPCKDHQSDEPDNGASLTIIVADSLSAIGNGRLVERKPLDGGRTAWKWEVKNPINNYNIIPTIGKYANWEETLAGEKGNLSASYWVLDYNLERAKKQFGRDVPRTIHCFEHWFGPYPFYNDGFKLVESPHLGMEHQSAVAYGNHYMNGYLGMDLSGTGWGQKWDYIIVHETGHEWFGNNITTADIADMWIHEGFTSYSEVLFVECEYGKEAGNEYCQGLRKGIANDQPVIGPYGVNKEGSDDMYPKGANLIHTVRQLIDDDKKFREILRGLNRDFFHGTTTSREVESYISRKSGKDLGKVFEQYLRHEDIPTLEYRIEGQKLSYRWTNCILGFDMPLRIVNSRQWIYPTTAWKSLSLPKETVDDFQIDPNFYINTDAN